MSDSSHLSKRYSEIRAATLALADSLSEADCSAQSMPDASPVKWHLAHTTWFFETFVLERFELDDGAGDSYVPFDPSFRVLFNSYYNSVGEQYPRSQRGLITRPGRAEVERYRAFVDERVVLLLADGDVPAELLALIELGLQHEQQHQELIVTDLKHAFSFNPTHPVYRERCVATSPSAEGAALDWQGLGGGLVEVGFDGEGFAFDNERPRHRVFLEDFEIASRPVSNAEWIEFMRDGGYERPELWLSSGWATIQAESIRAPLYWSEQQGLWTSFTTSGLQPVVEAEPVCHVSYYEADAFASWARARLPTEQEWETAAERQWSIASAGQAPTGNFAESGPLHPAPGGGFFGDVWEWTASPYVGYPRYRHPAGALGEYNGKFMADQWVLRGGSCATPRSHIRATYRNFFPASARWQFSGLRLARDGS